MMIWEILVNILTCLLISPLSLACWRGMINLIYLFIYISKLQGSLSEIYDECGRFNGSPKILRKDGDD